jgi:NFU1 iron-sulfur cluster scaffold homolog, mitochondrial
MREANGEAEPKVLTVTVEATPNHDARMFRVQTTLVPDGTFAYASIAQAADAPLAQALLALPGVNLLMVAPHFVTVRKEPDAAWESVQPLVTTALGQFLRSGDMAVLPGPEVLNAELAHSHLERLVLKVLDEDIRPALAMDGGDLEFEGIVDNIVRVRLIGACETCPSSGSTLRFGIERMLLEEFPELRGVEEVE